MKPRNSNDNQLLSIVFTFSDDIASVGGSSVRCEMSSSTVISGNTVTVSINGRCNGQDVDVTLPDVTGAVNGDRRVNNTGVVEVRMDVGRGGINDWNFRDDVTVVGENNQADSNLVRAARGASLP